MPEHTLVKLKDWKWPEPFLEVQKRTNLSRDEMVKTLNCGIGLTLFVEDSDLNVVTQTISRLGFNHYDLGVVETSNQEEASVEF